MREDPGFQEQYEPVAPALTAWAHLRCRGPLGNAIAADDLVQEVVLAAWRARERFDPQLGTFRGWLFGIANRVAAEALRQTARRTPPTDLDREPVAELTTISRRVRRREAMTGLLERLAGLTPPDRDLITYRGIEGLEHKAVAELLGISAEAATKRWQRLRDQIADWPAIRDLLSEYDLRPPT